MPLSFEWDETKAKANLKKHGVHRRHRVNERPMKKGKNHVEPDMLDEYDFSKGVRGKYAKRYAQGTNVVLLSPDVAKFFPDSESVNDALRALVQVARRTRKRKATR